MSRQRGQGADSEAGLRAQSAGRRSEGERAESWQQERARVLSQARVVVVKVGSAVLTDASGLNSQVLEGLAAQLAFLRDLPLTDDAAPAGQSEPAPHATDASAPAQNARRLVLVSSGAVAAGRAALASRGRAVEPAGLSARQAAAAVGQGQLMQSWDKVFLAHGMPTAQVLLTRDDLRARQRFLNARNTFAELLQWGVLPIVNENDTVSISELKFGDNDCLASLLVNLVEADLFINLTSSSGVLAADPQKHPDAPVMDHIDDVAALDLGQLCGGKTSVGTGGMYSKLLAARRAAQLGVPTLILPGREPAVIGRAFAAAGACSAPAGHEPFDRGTWVRPAHHAIARRKFWLAYQSDPAGSVHVDDGAARALLHKGGSLLPGGVRAVEGGFQCGGLVRVLHNGESIGVGLSNYSAPDLKKIMGLKRHEVAAILGDAHYPEVIHRDNLLLDAAI
ncbi:MAG: glutamate 5-kinase [Desulfovibrio sp.]|uniref:glutamate 5-kinase n=1 Tax=Desulfovibrio sp. TaxID=885 RepID=UPI002A35BD99|nr:glutamate 5-kinase [Desulfovibrio sp.]MDY0260781.1 glutamate 5-kinase [Desulfovibrio sp.]